MKKDETKDIRSLVASFSPIDLAFWCFMFWFPMWFARFQILISELQMYWVDFTRRKEGWNRLSFYVPTWGKGMMPVIEIDIFPHYFPLLDAYNLMKNHRYSQFQVTFVLSSLFILIMKHKQLLFKYFEFCNSAFVKKFFDEINFWP